MKYSLIDLGIGDTDAQIFYGTCLPQNCSDELIKNKLDSALSIVGLPFNVFGIYSNPESYEYPITWLSYLTILIIIGILLLVFVASVKGYKNARPNKWLQSFNIVSNMKHFNIR